MVAATGSMFVIGRRLITVSENKNQAEAEYRYLLTRVRENGEGIALLKGEDEERSGVDRSFKSVLRGWRDVCIGLADQRLYSADPAHHSVRTQIPGQRDDARRSHAGGIGVRNCAISAQLACR